MFEEDSEPFVEDQSEDDIEELLGKGVLDEGPIAEPPKEFFESFQFEPIEVEADESEEPEEELEERSCDHDPEHKDTETIPQSAGTSFGGFGVSVGSGEPVLICAKCEKIYSLEDARESAEDRII